MFLFSEFFFEFFSFVWSNVLSLVWYMSIVLNLLLHSYKRLDTFNFLFSSIWYCFCVVISWYWELCILLYICYIRLGRLLFLSCSLNFYLLWTFFWVFEGEFSFYNYITCSIYFLQISTIRWKLRYNNHIYSFSHERLRNQTVLSKDSWKLKNMGLTPEIQ